MNLQSFICDYDYRCLEQRFCPHFEDCEVSHTIIKRCRKAYAAMSQKRSRKGYTHDNARTIDLKKIYAESLRHGFLCVYCRKPMVLETGYMNTSSIDHKLSQGMGGDNSYGNLLLCCVVCNREKSIKENAVMNGVRV